MNAVHLMLQTLIATPAVQVDDLVHQVTPNWAQFILWLPLISLVLCGVCAALKVKSKAPALITIICLASSFVLTLMLYRGYEGAQVIPIFDWIQVQLERGVFHSEFCALCRLPHPSLDALCNGTWNAHSDLLPWNTWNTILVRDMLGFLQA